MPDPTLDDCRHRLPQPQPVNPEAPFVGNETRDDNLEESIRIALYVATRGDNRSLDVEVFGGRVVLTGKVGSKEIGRRCEALVRSVQGVASVNNLLSWDD